MIGDPKKIAAEIVGKGEMSPPEAGDDLGVLAQDLIDAMKAGDAQGVADAFRACVMACESEPHVEAGEAE